MQSKVKAPAAVWSAAFFVVVFVAELVFGQGTVRGAFGQVGTAAAALAAVAAWIAKAWEEYQRVRYGAEATIHAQDRDALNPPSPLARWLWG